MKSLRQVLNFLDDNQLSSQNDAEEILNVIKNYYHIPLPYLHYSLATPSSKNPITLSQFTNWLGNGYASYDIVRYHKDLYMVGVSLGETLVLVTKLEGNEIVKDIVFVNMTEVIKATEEETEKFLQTQFSCKIKLCRTTMKLEPTYIPEHDEKIIFHKFDFSEEGVGVVRHVDLETGKIELYCYFIYPTPEKESRIGYSMHENGIVDLTHYVVDPIGDKTEEAGVSGAASFKRLRRELERHNKIWKDKLHRIEPLCGTVKKGERYWYINDKLKIVLETEKDTPTSHFRYIAGNYFIDYDSALEVLSRIHDTIQKYMASPGWPKSDILK